MKKTFEKQAFIDRQTTEERVERGMSNNKQDTKTPSQKAASNYLNDCLRRKHAAENKSMERADALFTLVTTAWFLAFFSSMFLGFHGLCLYLACCMGFVILGVIGAGLIGLAKETIAEPLKTLFS